MVAPAWFLTPCYWDPVFSSFWVLQDTSVGISPGEEVSAAVMHPALEKQENKKQKPITFIYVSGMGRGHGDCCVSWVEVRGQFLATSSSLPPCGYRGLISRWWTALVTGAFTYWAILQSPPLFRLLARHSPTAECPQVQWDQPMLQVRIRSFSMSCWQPRCLWLAPVFSDGLCSGWRLTCWLWAPLQAKEALEITTVFRRLMENYSLLSRVQKAN